MFHDMLVDINRIMLYSFCFFSQINGHTIWPIPEEGADFTLV